MHVLESRDLRLTILPKRGAKISSLWRKSNRAELLWQPATSPADTRLTGDPSVAFDASQAWGWDEMFPAIGAETFEDTSGTRTIVPDHGEVWTLPWQVVEVIETDDAPRITLEVTGEAFPYRLTRTTILTGATVRNEYRLENGGDNDLPWMWAAHPLFALGKGNRLVAPPGWDRVRNAYDSPAMRGYDRLYRYPGRRPELDVLPDPESGVAMKYFFERPNTDPTAALTLLNPEAKLGISVRADPAVTPWFGVWCNAGGLFGHRNLAIEPASAPMDTLSAAARLGRLPRLPPGGSISWWMEVSVSSL